MKIYISGSISKDPKYKEKFQKAAEEIKAKGHEPINPVEIEIILNPETTTWEQFMRVDISLLKCCEAICLLPDWETSVGAIKEKMVAEKHELIVYYNVDDIPQKVGT